MKGQIHTVSLSCGFEGHPDDLFSTRSWNITFVCGKCLDMEVLFISLGASCIESWL
jgi:hypothetical protein